MQCFCHKYAFTIFLSEGEVNELPETYRKLIDGHCVSDNRDDKQLAFNYVDIDYGRQVSERIKNYQRNKVRANSRKNLEYYNCSGVVEKKDIEDIRKLQDNKCYYTGNELTDKNYSIDHMTPVAKGGSFWPSNIALVLKEVNLDKHDRSATQYWSLLKKKHGAEWLKSRKDIAKTIDRERKKIDHRRRKEILSEILRVSNDLNNEFEMHDISLDIFDGNILLTVDGIEVEFPKGFVRIKRKYNNSQYYKSIIESIIK